jgi:hypothetical protein
MPVLELMTRYAAGGNVSFFKDNRRISLVGNFNNINQQNFASQDLLGVTSGGGNREGLAVSAADKVTVVVATGLGGGGNFGSQSNFLVGQQSGITKQMQLALTIRMLWEKKVTVTGSYFFNNSNN